MTTTPDDLIKRALAVELLILDVDGVLTDGVIEAVGLAACPADAAGEVLQVAHLVTTAPGGRGAVREVVEEILKIQGAWNGVVARSRGTP